MSSQGPADDELAQLAPDAYAGSWLDEDGLLHVAYTGDADRYAVETQQRLGISSQVVVVAHRRSLRELEAIADAAFDADWWATHGATVYAAEVDVIGNVVEVTVEPLTDSARSAAEERFGNSVHLVEGRVEAV